MTGKRQMSETYIIGMILAVVGGFLDAYTYISRGKVFANAQTGNIVLLGVNFAEGEFKEAAFYLLPILAFFVGIIGAEMIKKRHKYNENIHWRQIVIGAEIIILFAIAFIPMGRYDGLVNISISLICAMQVEAFRKVNGTALSTTMCTGNLRTGTEQVYRAIIEKSKDKVRIAAQAYGIVIFFSIGAAIGGIVTRIYMERSILIASAMLLIVFISMFRNVEKYILKELEEDDEIEEEEIDSEIEELKENDEEKTEFKTKC